jgi:gamma-glutamylcyclotransferase (GGCT)/AIG2-like uncharacterized protein YtfP
MMNDSFMEVEIASYLFVYGTLRKGIDNPVKQEIMNDVEWLGESEIRGNIYDIGKYPGAVPAKNNEGGVIKGEILKIKDPEKVLKILDRYEGYNPEELIESEYYRSQEKVKLPDGRDVNAWIYWYNFSVNEKTRIEQNDYLEHLKKKSRST